MAGIVLEGVSRVYPSGVVAVDRLDLEVREGELLVLVGPSGCGKSTTLRLIAGLEELSSGSIRIGERVVNDVAPRSRDVAMVFQNFVLYPHLSVRENMAFPLELRHSKGRLARAWRRVLRPIWGEDSAPAQARIDEQVDLAAHRWGIESLLDRQGDELSGGERQRVALARAMVRKPAAFLLDEPMSNLDAKLRLEMRRELKQLHGQLATTTVYVTHDQHEAMSLADRVALLDRGRIQQVGPPLEVYDAPANRFVAAFIGSLPMNFIEGIVAACDQVGGTTGFCLESPHWPVAASGSLPSGLEIGQRVVLGIRPEDVEVVFGSTSPPADTKVDARKSNWLAGRIELVELLGESSVVYFTSDLNRDFNRVRGESRLVAQATPRARPVVGQPVWARIDLDRAHWFDSRSGENLGNGKSSTVHGNGRNAAINRAGMN